MSSGSDLICTRSGTEYKATHTGDRWPSLEPICLVARSGAAHLQDYFTPMQARDLGARLMALALEVESDDAELEHFDRIEAEGYASLQQAKAAGALVDAVLGAESPAEAA